MTETEKQLNNKIHKLEKELALLQLKNQRSEEAYNNLLYALKEFQRNRFGSKSERFVDNNQGDLFAVETAAVEDSGDNIINIESYKRSKNKKRKFPEELPRKELIIKAKDRICSCGKEKQLIRYETTELLNYKPAVFEVIVQKREVLACCCGRGSITTAANPPRILPKVFVTESLLAYLIVSKLHDRQPLYHLEKKLNDRFGIEISRNNQSRWFIDCAKALQPLINLMKDQVIDYDVASADATSLQVLDEPERKATTKSYWYCIRGGPPNKKVILYDYNAEKHKLFLMNWFAGFKGYIHVDAQNIFDELGAQDDVDLIYCHAHARRKFEAITKQTKTDGLAKQAMVFYRKLYRIEKQTKNMDVAERYAYREEHANPLLKNHQKWLEANYPTLLPKSPLGKAFAYSIKQFDGLNKYLEDGRLEIDNNGTEREIKPGVIARKNFLFAKSVAGARALCVHMSLIRTALLHGFDPYKYYVAVMEKIPYCKIVNDYEALLPWNIELKKVRESKAIAVA